MALNGPPRRIRLRANSKLNLFLRVMGRRPDDYHEIETILHGIDLGDDIEVATSTAGIEIEMINAVGASSEMPPAEQNLITTAVRCLQAHSGIGLGVRAKVIKRVPLGAGLGGGSADAAAIVSALNELWRLRLDAQSLTAIAATIGSDVPYCLVGGTCLATGRGEAVTPLPAPANLHFVLGLSDVPLMTGDVYKMADELGPAPAVGSAPMSLALGAADVAEVGALLHNDLEPAAFQLRPELAARKQQMLAGGALGACLSGSGPTLFALASNEGHARQIASRVRQDFDRVMVATSALRSIELLD